jgi:hypothetical protein
VEKDDITYSADLKYRLMNVLQKIKNSPASLLPISAILLFLAVLAHELFIFIAIAPLFALLDVRINVRSASAIVSGLFALAAMAFLMREISPATGTVFYIIVIMMVFVFYQAMQQLTQNRLNKFSLTILLIGVEYLLLKLSLGSWITFFADAIQDRTDWIRWNIYTGYLGSSAWILLVNLLFYQALFKNELIGWIMVILGLLAILLPVLYSIDLTNNALTKQQVIRFYMGDESGLTYPYLSHGELISRTAAWLSILIIIFTLVRAKTKKVAR